MNCLIVSILEMESHHPRQSFWPNGQYHRESHEGHRQERPATTGGWHVRWQSVVYNPRVDLLDQVNLLYNTQGSVLRAYG